MTSPYENVFYYYRGPSTRTSDGDGYDQQLEDNTTKALVNTLMHSEPGLTDSFLRHFLGTDIHIGQTPFYYLQKSGLEKTPRSRWLIAIAPVAAIASKDRVEDEDAGSRVDAAIHIPGQILAALEIKVGTAELQEQQLKAHARRWRVARKFWRLVSWEDVYHWARAEQQVSYDRVTQFLLSQLLALMRATGLTPFVGLEDDDFRFFEDPSWERQVVVKGHLASLWKAVLDRLRPEERAALGEIHLHQVPLDAKNASAQTNWGEDVVNLTLEMTAQGVQLNVVAWKRDPSRAFESWLTSRNGRKTVRALQSYELVIYRRRASNYAARKTLGARPIWRGTRLWDLRGRRRATRVTGPWLDQELQRIRNRAWEKPAFHMRHEWARGDAVRRGAELAGDVAAQVARLLPILDDVNS